MPTQRPDPVHRQFTARLQIRRENTIQLFALEQVQSLGLSRAHVFPTTHIGISIAIWFVIRLFHITGQ
jgi:hypothetical protein